MNGPFCAELIRPYLSNDALEFKPTICCPWIYQTGDIIDRRSEGSRVL